jgi:hypothetical protein
VTAGAWDETAFVSALESVLHRDVTLRASAAGGVYGAVARVAYRLDQLGISGWLHPAHGQHADCMTDGDWVAFSAPEEQVRCVLTSGFGGWLEHFGGWYTEGQEVHHTPEHSPLCLYRRVAQRNRLPHPTLLLGRLPTSSQHTLLTSESGVDDHRVRDLAAAVPSEVTTMEYL